MWCSRHYYRAVVVQGYQIKTRPVCDFLTIDLHVNNRAVDFLVILLRHHSVSIVDVFRRGDPRVDRPYWDYPFSWSSFIYFRSGDGRVVVSEGHRRGQRFISSLGRSFRLHTKRLRVQVIMFYNTSLAQTSLSIMDLLTNRVISPNFLTYENVFVV